MRECEHRTFIFRRLLLTRDKIRTHNGRRTVDGPDENVKCEPPIFLLPLPASHRDSTTRRRRTHIRARAVERVSRSVGGWERNFVFGEVSSFRISCIIRDRGDGLMSEQPQLESGRRSDHRHTHFPTRKEIHIPRGDNTYPFCSLVSQHVRQLCWPDSREQCFCIIIHVVYNTYTIVLCLFSHRKIIYSACRKTLMILPQVHLRKPCYDFYFL